MLSASSVLLAQRIEQRKRKQARGVGFKIRNSKSVEEGLTGGSGSLGKTMNSIFALLQRLLAEKYGTWLVEKAKWKPKKMLPSPGLAI
jgi:hypothetical protein